MVDMFQPKANLEKDPYSIFRYPDFHKKKLKPFKHFVTQMAIFVTFQSFTLIWSEAIMVLDEKHAFILKKDKRYEFFVLLG